MEDSGDQFLLVAQSAGPRAHFAEGERKRALAELFSAIKDRQRGLD